MMSRSSTIIDERAPVSRVRTHPGEVLREEFMQPLGLSANALALALRVPATQIGAIIREHEPRAVTADTALRLARYFGTTPEFWLNLQTAYDLSHSRLDKISCNGGVVVQVVYGKYHKYEIVRESGIIASTRFRIRRDGEYVGGSFLSLKDAVEAAQAKG